MIFLKPGANESQKTINKKQNGLAHSRFIVCVTPKEKKTLLDSKIMFWRNMCETANQQYIMVVYMVSKMRCRWLTFRWCFVSRVRYPEICHFEMQTPVCLIRKTLFSGTLFIVSGWRRRVCKTVLFRVSHLFSVFFYSRLRRALKWGALSLKRSVLKRTHILTPFNVKIASNYAFLFLDK